MNESENPITTAYAPNPGSGDSKRTAQEPNSTNPQPLRWWPAVVILGAMLAISIVPKMIDSPPFPVMMAGFMGPAAVGLLILVWWLVASRANWKEKIVGLIGFLLIAVAGVVATHSSMKGMGIVILVIPTAIAAFAITLILLARKPAYRVFAALLFTALTFGLWDSVQSLGVTGSFSTELAWRWTPTAEEVYLSDLNDRGDKESSAAVDAPNVTLASAQWPAFRGPIRDGVLSGVVLAEDWDASPPKKLWGTKIGPGWSSFSVAGDRLFTQEQRGDSEAVVCLNATSGAILWDFTYPSRFWESVAGAGPRATPTIADEGLFALGASGILLCLDAATGKQIWQRDLKSDASRQPPQWGFSASPLVCNGVVIVHAGGPGEKGLLAYDALTGEPKWSVPSGDHSYSSAQLATFDSVNGLLMATNAGLQFVSVDDGHTIWEYKWPVQNYRALQPLVVGNSILLATSLGEGTRRLTAVHEAGDSWKIVEDWTSLEMKPEFNDFVVFDGHVYGFDGNIFACIDLATGKRKWKKGRYGSGQVLLLADSGQLLVTSEKGDVILLRATPEKLEELGKFNAIEGKTWNHPVLVGNHLYVRNAGEAACYELVLK